MSSSSSSVGRLRGLAALVALAAAACTSPETVPPDATTDTQPVDTDDSTPSVPVATGDTSASPTLEPCDLSTPRILKATDFPTFHTTSDPDVGFHDVGAPFDDVLGQPTIYLDVKISASGPNWGAPGIGSTVFEPGGDVAQSVMGLETYLRGFLVNYSPSPPSWRTRDFDGDGHPERWALYGGRVDDSPSGHTEVRGIAGSHQGYVSWADADWVFALPEGDVAVGHAHADLDGDGQMDLVVFTADDMVLEATSYSARVFRGPFPMGRHELTAPVAEIDMGAHFPTFLGHLQLEDFDGDGLADVSFGVEIDGRSTFHVFTQSMEGAFDLSDATASFVVAARHHLPWTWPGRFGLRFDVADMTGDGIPDLAIGEKEADRGGGLAAVFAGPFDGAYTTDDAHLLIESPGERDDVVGMDTFFHVVDDGPPVLIVISAYQAPEALADPIQGRQPNGAFLVFDQTQSGRLTTDDAKVIVVNDGLTHVALGTLPLGGDVDGDGRDDLVFGYWEKTVVPQICP